MVPRGVRGRRAIYLAPSRRHTGILGAASDLLCTLTTPYGRSRGTRPLVLCPLDAMLALSGPVFIYDVPSLCHTSPAEECIWARHFQAIRSCGIEEGPRINMKVAFLEAALLGGSEESSVAS